MRPRRAIRQGTLCVVALLCALVAASCSRRDGPRPKTYDFVNLVEPKRLDPAFMYDVYEGVVSGLMYDGLVLFGRGSDLRPGLAERWEVSPDGLTHTFHLREAKFSDGTPVTSADVRYSFTRILRPETNSDRKAIFAAIAGADAVTSGITRDLRGLETPDARTVVIRLSRPYPAFLVQLAMPNAVIIPFDRAGAGPPDPAWDRHPVSSGPWVLEKWLRDQRLEFRRNEHWWGPRPPVDRYIYHVQSNEYVQAQLFEIGRFDEMAIGFSAFAKWSRDPARRGRMMPLQELNTYYFGFMNSKPKLADKRVRQAISHAIDTRNIFVNLQKERGLRAHGPVPPGISGHRPQLRPREHDPDKARRLLAAAGATTLTIEICYTDD